MAPRVSTESAAQRRRNRGAVFGAQASNPNRSADTHKELSHARCTRDREPFDECGGRGLNITAARRPGSRRTGLILGLVGSGLVILMLAPFFKPTPAPRS